ncbi:MAG: TIGR02281 family clan AA aspartic protease [Gammaproteobacteria bacterium]|nr:TIGR02281 family clan AA aspartic protease [Gammaproteobacteria bacterium]
MTDQDREAEQQRRMGGWMYIGFWILLLVFVAMFFSRWLDHQRNPNQQVASRIDGDGVREVVLKRNRMGHYNVTGDINGHSVEFMLDTGATDIAIPASIATDLGLQRLGRMQFETANGIAEGYATRLHEVRVGNIVLHDLAASINPNMNDDIVLLGMSFLKKIEFTQRGDSLILRQ